MNLYPKVRKQADRIWVRRREASEMMNCSVRTVDTMVRNGQLPSQKVRGMRLIKVADIESLMQSESEIFVQHVCGGN